MTIGWKTGLLPVAFLGRKTRKLFRYLSVLSVFIYLPLRRTLLPPYSGIASIRRTTVMQIYFTAIQALPLFLFLSIVFGLSIPMGLRAVSLQAWFLALVVKWVIPLLSALIIIGRSGTAITVELANMTVLGEIRQLRCLGVDPFRHVIFPRLIGVTSAMFFLGLFYGAATLITAAAASSAPYHSFVSEYMKHTTVHDAMLFSLRQVVFGMIISTVACYQGLNLEPLTTDVPKATIRTVIHGIVFCVLFDFFLLALNTMIGRLN
jgi:phospholipid/cholesterol/gamma-HCH transport system permease protein